MKTAPADYVFALEVMIPTTGLYELMGIVADEDKVKSYFENAGETAVCRVEVFILGDIEGPVRIINSLEEFMEFP